MSGGWIDALALIEATDVSAFERLLGRHVSGADATFEPEDHLIVVPDTDEDEALFRLPLPDWDAIGGIRVVGERGYVLPVHLRDDVRRWIGHGLFEGAASLLTVVRLEPRDEGVFRRLDAALGAERASFVGQRPRVWWV